MLLTRIANYERMTPRKRSYVSNSTSLNDGESVTLVQRVKPRVHESREDVVDPRRRYRTSTTHVE